MGTSSDTHRSHGLLSCAPEDRQPQRYWRRCRRKPHEACCWLLREASPWPSSATPGQGLPAVVSAQVHERQKPKRCPSAPPDRRPSGYELRQPVLLPSASPQEQRALSWPGNSEKLKAMVKQGWE